ncbi:MAG: hypothetical protein ACXWYS_06845, partial [Gaiellaceae bacterium]
MSEWPPDPSVPEKPGEGDSPRIGVDEWVASAEGRREQAKPIQRAWRHTPPLGRQAILVIPAIAFPVF